MNFTRESRAKNRLAPPSAPGPSRRLPPLDKLAHAFLDLSAWGEAEQAASFGDIGAGPGHVTWLHGHGVNEGWLAAGGFTGGNQFVQRHCL